MSASCDRRSPEANGPVAIELRYATARSPMTRHRALLGSRRSGHVTDANRGPRVVPKVTFLDSLTGVRQLVGSSTRKDDA